MTRAHKLECMQALFLYALAYISARIGQIRDKDVSTESGGHTAHFKEHVMTPVSKLTCMNSFLLAYL